MDIGEVAATELARRADRDMAAGMAAYMKTAMPFYGVKKPEREPILRRLVDEFPPPDAGGYRARVTRLWELPHREEKYLAIGYARRFRAYVTPVHLDLYRRMIVEGAWWDLVDEIAAHLVGPVLLHHRSEVRPVMEKWIDSDDMWLRRAALLGQLRHKDATDASMLFDFCRRRAHEKEFFIRKAIGWALREYSRTDPAAVAGFVAEEGDRLSGLSRREAARHL